MRAEAFWLVLSPESKEAEIEVGYGLESVVTPEVFTSLRDDSILPSLAERKLNAAAIQGVYAILEALSSPLVAEWGSQRNFAKRRELTTRSSKNLR